MQRNREMMSITRPDIILVITYYRRLELSFWELVYIQNSSLKFVRVLLLFFYLWAQLFSFKRALALLEWVVFAPNQSPNSSNQFNLVLN